MTFGFSRIEIKYADAPGASRSRRVALDDLGLEHLWVVYPGRHEYALDERISALPVHSLPNLAAGLR